jgi:DNA-binding GntR family transcriptional regulator
MMSELPQLQPLEVLNLREHIERLVRNAILDGAFAPGERLVESAIAEQLNVSRAPVREALAALAREGVVVHVPRRGYSVVQFTDKDVEEIYSLRLLLETEALRRAVECATERDLAEMQRVVDELGQAALDQGEPERIVELDFAFHEYICRVAGHSRLYAAWRSTSTQTRVLIGLTSRTHYDQPEQPKELHQRILKAIRDKDLEKAEELLSGHILDAQRRAESARQKLPGDRLHRRSREAK